MIVACIGVLLLANKVFIVAFVPSQWFVLKCNTLAALHGISNSTNC